MDLAPLADLLEVSEADVEKYLAEDFTIKGTAFRIKKLLPMEGYRVIRRLRVAVGERLGSVADTGSAAGGIAAVLASIPEDTEEWVRVQLFAHVRFQKPDAPMGGRGEPVWRPCHPEEALAFKGLNVAAIYEVFVRAFLVNFIDSFEDILSTFLGATGASSSSDTSTSPPSSPSQ